MAELNDDDADALAVTAGATAQAMSEIASWLKPDATIATALTLGETALAILLASAAKSAPGKSLDEIIERTQEHTKMLARFYFERASS